MVPTGRWAWNYQSVAFDRSVLVVLVDPELSPHRDGKRQQHEPDDDVIARHAPLYHKGVMMRKCVICKEAFDPKRCDQKCCSKKCGAELQRRSARERYERNQKKRRGQGALL